MNTVDISVHIHTFCILIIIVFHLLLIFGLPLGHLTMAGKFPGRLPWNMRVFSIFSIFILLLMLIFLEIAAGNIFNEYHAHKNLLNFIVISFNFIQVILHIITPSKYERLFWLPVVLVMFITSVLVKYV